MVVAVIWVGEEGDCGRDRDRGTNDKSKHRIVRQGFRGQGPRLQRGCACWVVAGSGGPGAVLLGTSVPVGDGESSFDLGVRATGG